MKLVIIESPYAASNGHSVEENLAYLRAAMHDCLKRGESPYASHALYTQPGVLDDNIPEERILGIEAGFEWRNVSQLTAVYTDLGTTFGMEKGIDNSVFMRRPVEYRQLEGWPREVDAVDIREKIRAALIALDYDLRDEPEKSCDSQIWQANLKAHQILIDALK